MMAHARYRRALGIGGLALALVAVLVSPSMAVAAAASCQTPATSSGSGIDMTATVIGPDGCPSDDPSGGGTNGGGETIGGGSGTRGASSSSGRGPAAEPSATVETSSSDPTPTADEVGLKGILNVGGLTANNSPSLNPFGGDLQLSFTVRNVSSSTVEATADFWIAGPFGNRISSVDGVLIADLKPGETRTVSADVPGVGQWTILTAHATFNPPSTVDGEELTPFTREATVFALPWLVVLLIAAVLAAWVIVQVVRRRNVAEPVGAFA